MTYLKKLYLGRMGRVSFWIGSLLSFSIFWLGSQNLIKIPSLLEIILYLVSLVYFFSFTTRRLHDLDQSGWLSLLLFIPPINAILGVYLTFFPGKEDENKYGKPPEGPKNLIKNLFVPN